MPISKKQKRRLYYLLGALCFLLAGGTWLLLQHSSTLSRYFSLDSACRFDPKIDENIKVLIGETISTVANKSLFSLMGKKSHLREMGDTISRAITDFAYWGYVFSTPYLAQDMKKIQGSSLKYNGFLEGTQNKMMREYRSNPCFFEQAQGFARYLHLSEQQLIALLKECIARSDSEQDAFKPYLDYLIAHKAG